MTTFVIETVDEVGNAGQRTSLVLDTQSNPHIAYTDGDTGALKYVRKNGGSWMRETVPSAGSAGGERGVSLALDGSGNPHIAYENLNGSELRYARKAGSGWTVEIVPDVEPAYVSLALDVHGSPHIAFYDRRAFGSLSETILKYASKSGSAWTFEGADDDGDVGHFASLALDADGNPHIAHCKRTQPGSELQRLKHSRKFPETGWTSGAGAGLIDSEPIFCEYASLALDAQGDFHIAYCDRTYRRLKYASSDHGVVQIEIVDQAGDPHDLGQYAAVALNAQGRARIAYYDAINGNLKFAVSDGGINWTVEVVDSDGNVGQYASLALDAQGNPHIAYYDRTNTALKYARATGN
jgi:hypothetical protein